MRPPLAFGRLSARHSFQFVHQSTPRFHDRLKKASHALNLRASAIRNERGCFLKFRQLKTIRRRYLSEMLESLVILKVLDIFVSRPLIRGPGMQTPCPLAGYGVVENGAEARITDFFDTFFRLLTPRRNQSLSRNRQASFLFAFAAAASCCCGQLTNREAARSARRLPYPTAGIKISGARRLMTLFEILASSTPVQFGLDPRRLFRPLRDAERGILVRCC